jgi:hypothetical protein
LSATHFGARHDRLAKTGLNAKLTLQVSTGTYGLREIAEETVDRKPARSTHPAEIR